MQTPDKLTRPFVFKLLVLFALLLSGAMLKVPKVEKSSNIKSARNISEPEDPHNNTNQQLEQHTLGLVN